MWSRFFRVRWWGFIGIFEKGFGVKRVRMK